MYARNLCIIVGLLALSISASQSGVDSPGPALYLGYGNLNGDIGARFEYQIKKPGSLFTVSPNVAIGAVPVKDLLLFGWNTGVLLEVGHLQRAFLGLSYGFIEGESDQRSFDFYGGTYTVYNVIVGPSVLIGYKGMLKTGLCWNIGAGAGEIDNPLNTNRINGPYLDQITFSYSIGLGYKF